MFFFCSLYMFKLYENFYIHDFLMSIVQLHLSSLKKMETLEVEGFGKSGERLRAFVVEGLKKSGERI